MQRALPSRRQTRIDCLPLSEPDCGKAIRFTGQSVQHLGALGNEESPRDTVAPKLGTWILVIVGSLAVSGLLGLVVALLTRGSEELLCCCGPFVLAPLATIFARLAWKEFGSNAEDKVTAYVAIAALTCFFALALVILFISVCSMLATPTKF